jgi:hypothetical protein
MKRLAAVVLLCFLTGCASAPTIPAHLDVERQTGEEPPLGTRSERSVGEVIYEVYNYEIRRDSSSRLLGHLTIDVLAASAHLSPEVPLVATVDKGLAVYCSAQPILRVAGEANVAHVCLRDQDGDHKFDLWRSPDGPPARWGWAPLRNHVGYEDRSSVEMAQTGDGFRYELLYQGLSSGVVKILYREYFDSLVRSAFQQEISYTIEEPGPTEISFRSVRMSIHTADNNRLEYTISAGLDSPSR